MSTSHYLDQKEYHNFLFESQIKEKATVEAEKILSRPEVLKMVQQIVQTRPDLQALAQGKDQNGNPIANAPQKMEEEIKKLAQQINTELQKNAKPAQGTKQRVNDSFEQDYSDLEIVDENIFNRAASKFRAGKEAILGGKLGQQPRNPKETAFLDRYQTFKKQMGKQLKELQLDLGKASDLDKTVKTNVSAMANELSQTFGINPSTSKFQEIRHKVTSGGLKLGIGAAVLAPIVALTAPLAASIGLGATAAGAVSGGLSTGLASMVKDLIYGQKPNIKKAAVATALGAVGGAIAGSYLNPAQQTVSPTSSDTAGMADLSQSAYGFQVPKDILTNIPQPESQQAAIDWLVQAGENKSANALENSITGIINDWPKLTKTVFGQVTDSGPQTLDSAADEEILSKVGNALYSAGKKWSELSMKEKAAMFNPIAKAVLK